MMRWFNIQLYAGPLIDLSMEQIQRTFDTNTYSLLRVAKAVIPSMAKRKQGLIVNIGSVVGEMLVIFSVSFCYIHTIDINNTCQPDSLEWLIFRIQGRSSCLERCSCNGMQAIQYRCHARLTSFGDVQYIQESSGHPSTLPRLSLYVLRGKYH
jgi:hypothetical protein